MEYYNSLKEKLEEIRNNKPIFGHDLDLELQEQVIVKQLGRLKNQMKEEH